MHTARYWANMLYREANGKSLEHLSEDIAELFVPIVKQVQRDVIQEAVRRREETPANLIADDMLEELDDELEQCKALGDAVEPPEPEGGGSIRG